MALVVRQVEHPAEFSEGGFSVSVRAPGAQALQRERREEVDTFVDRRPQDVSAQDTVRLLPQGWPRHERDEGSPALRLHRGQVVLPPRRGLSVFGDHRHGARLRRRQQHQLAPPQGPARLEAAGRQRRRQSAVHVCPAESDHWPHLQARRRSHPGVHRGRRGADRARALRPGHPHVSGERPGGHWIGIFHERAGLQPSGPGGQRQETPGGTRSRCGRAVVQRFPRDDRTRRGF